MVATNSLNINTSGLVTFDNVAGAFTQYAISQHDVLLAGASNAVVSLSPSTAGLVLASNGVSADPSFQSIASLGGITSITTDVGGPVTPTAGSVSLLGGTSGLTTTGSTSTWTITGDLNVAHGGTGLATLSTYQLMAGGTTATGVMQQVGIGSSGQVLTSNGAGALPTFQTPSAGFTWVDISTNTQPLAPNVGYVTDNASLVTYTLPVTAAFGTIIEITGGVTGAATAPWTIAQNAGQSINFGTSSTTVGVTGSLSANFQYDSVRILCIVADTTFVVLDSSGSLNVV